GVDERLERGAWLAAAAHRAVVRRLDEVGAADEREQVAGVRIHGNKGRLQSVAAAKRTQAVANRGFRGVLDLGDEACLDFPVGRIVASVDVAELLAEKFLRVALARVRDRGEWADTNLLGPRLLLLLGCDLLLLAHPLADDEAAAARGIEVRPRRVGGGRADDAGDQRRFAERQI